MATWAVSFFWVFFRSAKVSAVRNLPDYGTAGEESHFSVTITNTGRSRLAASFLEEWPPDPRPSFNEFAHTPEPGEELRNIVDRTFLYYRWTWLQERKRGFEVLEGKEVPKLQPGESARISFTLTPGHRGVLHFDQLRLLLPEPLGLFQRCQRIPAKCQQLVVLPKRYPLPEFRLPGESRLHVGGEAASNTNGQTGDFLNLRDYRPGDTLRSVDWKSWARTGAPVVREYEDSFFPRYGLALDTSGPGNQAFEEAVSVAASFVSGIDHRDCLLDLMFIRDEAIRVSAGRGLQRPVRLLEVLAEAEPGHDESLEALGELVIRHGEGLSSCFLIFPGWNEERAAMVQKIRRRDIDCRVLVVQDEVDDLPAFAHGLRTRHIEKDLARAAAHLDR